MNGVNTRWVKDNNLVEEALRLIWETLLLKNNVVITSERCCQSNISDRILIYILQKQTVFSQIRQKQETKFSWKGEAQTAFSSLRLVLHLVPREQALCHTVCAVHFVIIFVWNFQAESKRFVLRGFLFLCKIKILLSTYTMHRPVLAHFHSLYACSGESCKSRMTSLYPVCIWRPVIKT